MIFMGKMLFNSIVTQNYKSGIMTENESISFKWIRTFAMLSIVLCHLFEGYHDVGFHIFNVGVQVFLVMSGYLYGCKNIIDWHDWAKKRIKKIYFPYVVYLLVVIPLFALFHEDSLNWKSVPVYFANLQGIIFLGSQSGFTKIIGLNHVWFLTAIMFAYFSTPFLQKIKKYSNLTLFGLLAFVACAYLALPSWRYFFALSWIYLYAIGYLFANLGEKWKMFYLVLFVVALMYACIVFPWENVGCFDTKIYRLIHDLEGIFVVLVGVWLLKLKKTLKLPRFVSFLDKYSYPVFLVHYIIMSGPFSMSYITPYVSLNIVIMLLTTILVTYIFVKLLNYLEKLFLALFQKQK